MEVSSIVIYPLRDNINSFVDIYFGITEGSYERSYFDTLIKLSKVFYDSMGEVIKYKALLLEKTKELSKTNCSLTKLAIETEIFILNDKLDYLLSNKTDNPYNESCSEIAQQILEFYFDYLED